MEFKGIGEAKAITLIAALELGRRRKAAEAGEAPKITSSDSAFQIIYPLLADHQHEEFWLLLLNRANRVIGKENLSKGGVAGTVVDPKMVFHIATRKLASAIILAHNHPSGNLRPSEADRSLTRKLVEAGKVLDLPILDHLIVGHNAYYSFKDEGLI